MFESKTAPSKSHIYQFPYLAGETRSLRVVILRPGLFEVPVVCTLTKQRLDDDLLYEALIYEWGPPSSDPNVTTVMLFGEESCYAESFCGAEAFAV